MIAQKGYVIVRNFFDGNMKEIVSGAGITFGIKIIGSFITFAFNVLLSKSFGAEGAGIYFLALTITSIGATIGMFGLENTLLRFIGAHSDDGQWDLVKGVYQKGMSAALCISFISSLVIFVASPTISLACFSKPELTKPLRLMALGIPALTLVYLHTEALKGLRKIRDSQILKGIVIQAITLVGLLIFKNRISLFGVVGVFVGGSMFAAFLSLFLWRYNTPQLISIKGNFSTKKMLGSCIPLFWTQFTLLMTNWVAMITLGVWGTKAEVGVFGVALRTAMLTSFILISVNSIAAPKFASLYNKRDLRGLESIAKKTTIMMTIFAFPMIALFVFAPSQVMGLFGEEFRSGGLLLAIISVGQFVNVMTGSVGYLLVMTGNEKLMKDNTLIMAAITILLNILLVPLFGALGAAISTAISVALVNIRAMVLVKKHLNINVLPV